MTSGPNKKAVTSEEVTKAPKTCGIIMPISSIDGLPESHWKEVHAILTASIEAAGYQAQLVSQDADIGVIHKRIVHNIYFNELIVCDVSAKKS